MCCLSSAAALPISASSNKGPKITFTKTFFTEADFPCIDDKGNCVRKGNNCCTLTFEANNIGDPSITVTGSTKSNNGIVFIPKNFKSDIGDKTVTGISSDAKFPNTKTLAYPRDFESDENALNMTEIDKNNPGIGFASYDWKDEG